MADPRWYLIKELFAAAGRLPPDQRDSFLRARCGEDEDLRREVLSLLASHPLTAAPTPTVPPSLEGPGSRIGLYKLLERIGEGGFGTVFAAEQESPIRRRVALKVVKAGMDTGQVVARFEQERQALALMDHPNIAKVFDAGSTPGGRPYFVMELVRGDPITEYCDREKLTPAERLRLFVDVGRAVQHAHTKGVIHRDLKPSNVLVTIVDGKPVAKVIDFGVAKATQGRLTDKTLFTEHKQMIGTPLYMSPEQAHISGVDVDTRSDVYSLGVLLYELLTGTTPFCREELLDAGLAEMHRVLREVEPQKPSTRVATLGKTSNTVAAQRRVEVGKLGVMLRGDLDWIIMKCLEKERARRYETAIALVQDIERHLGGEAVEAAPPSMAYQVRKFVRRRRGQVAAAAAIAAVALAGVAAFAWSEVRRANLADDRRRDAEASAAVANQLRRESQLAFIAAADSALRAGDFAVVRDRLEECEPSLRGWEWSHVDEQTDRSILVVGKPDPSEQTGMVGVSFSSDGTQLYTTSTRPLSSELSKVDAVSGTLLGTSPGPDTPGGDNRFVNYCPTANLMAVAGSSGVSLIDPRSGSLLYTLSSPGDPGATSLCMSINGKRLASATSNRTIQVWDLDTRATVAQVPGVPNETRLLFLSDNGSRLITATYSEVHEWDVAGQRFSTIFRRPGLYIKDVACSRDMSTIVIASGFTLFVKSPDVNSVREILLRNSVQSLCLSSDGNMVVATSDSGNSWLVSLRDNRPPLPLVGHSDAVVCAAFSPDNSKIATGSIDGTARVWDTHMPTSIEPLAVESTQSAMAYSGDGSCFFISGGRDSMVRDYITGKAMTSLRPNRESDSVTLDRRGTRMVSDNGPSEPLLIWDITSGTLVRSLDIGHRCHALSEDGGHLIVGTADGLLVAFFGDNMKESRQMRSFDSPVASCAFSPKSKRFAAVSTQGEVEVWTCQPLALLTSFSVSRTNRDLVAEHEVQGIQFDNNGSRLAIMMSDNVQIWRDITKHGARLEASQAIAAGRKHLPRQYIRLSPNLEYILAIEDDFGRGVVHRLGDLGRTYAISLGGTVDAEVGWSRDRLFYADRERITCLDLMSGRKLLSLTTNLHWPCAVMLSPDGTQLIAADLDGGEAHRYHSRRYSERFPAIEATHRETVAYRARLSAARRTQLLELRRGVMDDPRLSNTERAGARIALCEAEETLRATAAREVESHFERFGKPRTADVGALHSAVQSVQNILDEFPEEYWFREVLGALLYRAGDFEAAANTLETATMERRKYASSPSFVGAAFTLLVSCNLLHRQRADDAKERIERVFSATAAPWAVDLRDEALAAYATAFKGRK